MTVLVSRQTLKADEGKVMTEFIRNELDQGGIDHVVLDMGQVDLITSPALGALIVIHKRLKTSNQMMILTNLSTTLREALGFLKLDKVFTICEGPEAIQKAIQTG